jgi:transposase-like protein
MKKTNQEKLNFWRAHLAACLESGNNMARYCREQGISGWQLSYWRKKLTAATVAKPVGFSKLCAAPVEVALSRIRVRVTEFELSDVAELRALFVGRS